MGSLNDNIKASCDERGVKPATIVQRDRRER